MADHKLVELVIDWLSSNWDTSNYPGTGGSGGGLNGQVPAFVDGDDAESESFEGRRVAFDLERNNAVIVSSSPARQQEPAGTAFNYRFEDGVSIRVAGLHADQYGHLSGSSEFRSLYQEVRRIIHAERTYPQAAITDQVMLDISILDETNLSSNYRDLYEYDITATFRGRETL